ncbi:MAG: hypothetical protein Q9170_007544 [Blastenia crenularia]
MPPRRSARLRPRDFHHVQIPPPSPAIKQARKEDKAVQHTKPENTTEHANEEDKAVQYTEPGNAGPHQLASDTSETTNIDRTGKGKDQAETQLDLPTEYPADLNAQVWRGKLTTLGVTEFAGVGKHVAGIDLGRIIPWAQILPELLEVNGRVKIEAANNYLGGLHQSQATKIGVVAVVPSNDEGDQVAFDKLFGYLVNRDRYGVILNKAMEGVQMTYLIPLEAGAIQHPDFLPLLEYCTIQNPVQERMLLMTIIIKQMVGNIEG